MSTVWDFLSERNWAQQAESYLLPTLEQVSLPVTVDQKPMQWWSDCAYRLMDYEAFVELMKATPQNYDNFRFLTIDYNNYFYSLIVKFSDGKKLMYDLVVYNSLSIKPSERIEGYVEVVGLRNDEMLFYQPQEIYLELRKVELRSITIEIMPRVNTSPWYRFPENIRPV